MTDDFDTSLTSGIALVLRRREPCRGVFGSITGRSGCVLHRLAFASPLNRAGLGSGLEDALSGMQCCSFAPRSLMDVTTPVSSCTYALLQKGGDGGGLWEAAACSDMELVMMMPGDKKRLAQADVEAPFSFMELLPSGFQKPGRALAYISFYLLTGPGLIMMNRHIVKDVGFHFPLTLALWSQLMGSLLTLGTVHFQCTEMPNASKKMNLQFFLREVLPIGVMMVRCFLLCCLYCVVPAVLCPSCAPTFPFSFSFLFSLSLSDDALPRSPRPLPRSIDRR